MNPTVLSIATQFKSLETQMNEVRDTLLQELSESEPEVWLYSVRCIA